MNNNMKLYLFLLYTIAVASRWLALANAYPVASNATISSVISSHEPSQSTASITWRHGPGPAKLETRTGNNYVVVPFGVLGDNGANPAVDAPTLTKPPDASKTDGDKTTMTENRSSSTSMTTPLLTTSVNPTSTISNVNINTQHTPISTLDPSSSLTTQPLAEQPTLKSTSNPTTAGLSTGAWKIVGIGVLSAIGIVLLVVAFIFHDKIFGAIMNRGKDEEQLVPDWKRGVWTPDGDDEEGPRVLSEKGGSMEFPLPPISPFPLRRALGKNGNASASTLVNPECDKDSCIPSVRVHGSDFSIIPSPPPPVHVQRSISKASSSSTSGYLSSPLGPNYGRAFEAQKTGGKNDIVSEDDVYGGIVG